MRVLPILFNTEMVRAILDGRKTCTRRLVKPQPKSKLCYTFAGSDVGTWGYPDKTAHEIWGEEFKLPIDVTKKELSKRWNPSYHTDDILYVRETWCGLPVNEAGHMRGHTIYYYKADGELRPKGWRGTWHPSIHMPKEAARIWLKVTDVRVEQLQEITEDGAKAEGINKEWAMSWWAPTYYDPDSGGYPEYRDTFAFEVWNKTIKKSDLDRYGWFANPYVFVIEFERCEKPEDNQN
jgi:hypothetical protein